jgi:hypothetical protein
MSIDELNGKTVMAGIEVDFDKRTITPVNPGCVITQNHVIGAHKIKTELSDIAAAAKRMLTVP